MRKTRRSGAPQLLARALASFYLNIQAFWRCSVKLTLRLCLIQRDLQYLVYIYRFKHHHLVASQSYSRGWISNLALLITLQHATSMSAEKAAQTLQRCRRGRRWRLDAPLKLC